MAGLRLKVTYQTAPLPVTGTGKEPSSPLCCSRLPGHRETARSASRDERQEGSTDAEAGVPLAEASGAICVQRLDDSRNSAIHIKYRISLRSSSLREPRYPLLRVVHSVVRRPITRNTGFSFSSQGQ